MAEKMVRLRFIKEYVDTVHNVEEAIREGFPAGDERFVGTLVKEGDEDDIFVQVPLTQAGKWVTFLEELADEERDRDGDEADRMEIIAQIMQEESEKLLGFSKTPKEKSGLED